MSDGGILSRAAEVVRRFPSRRVLVVGDIMLDEYVFGTVGRISPEAPVPVVAVTRDTRVPGGAANVAFNLRGLGAGVEIAGLLGGDGAGRFVARMLRGKRVGLSAAVVQEHVPGDLIKFYGVGRGDAEERDWFVWFYHRDQHLAGNAFEPAELARTARSAAASLGLEIFGGDAIATADGRLVLIDLNAWPSFALFREEASHHIAAHLAARFRKEAGTLI